MHWIPRDPSIRILDAGCGKGRYARQLVGFGYQEVFGVDLFQSSETNGWHHAVADIRHLPFTRELFDCVIALSVIYFVKDVEQVLAELCDRLKPGGLLFLSAHTKYSLYTLVRVLKRSVRLDSTAHLNNVQFRTAASYCALLRKAGMRIVDVDGFFQSPIPAITKRIRKADTEDMSKSVSPSPPSPARRLLASFRALSGYHWLIVAEKPLESISSNG